MLKMSRNDVDDNDDDQWSLTMTTTIMTMMMMMSMMMWAMMTTTMMMLIIKSSTCSGLPSLSEHCGVVFQNLSTTFSNENINYTDDEEKDVRAEKEGDWGCLVSVCASVCMSGCLYGAMPMSGHPDLRQS